MNLCPTCGKEVPQKAAFCPECGSKLPDDKRGKEQSSEVGEAPEGKDTTSREKTEAVAERATKKLASLPYADRAKRIAAGAVDVLIAFALLLPFYRFMTYPVGRRWRILLYVIPAVYMIFRDSLRGKSFGKFLFGLSTVNVRSNKMADFADSVLRNWFLFVIVLPLRVWILNFGVLFFIAICFIIFVQILVGQGSRIGDKFANTKVVEDRIMS